MTGEKIIGIRGLTKRFPGVTALDKVDFDLYEGEVHALVGENGSGKSTMMNIISGVYRQDEGSLWILGSERIFKDTKDARESGIATIFQELSLATDLSVAENIFIGRQIQNKLGFINKKEMRRQCEELLKEYGIKDVNAGDITGRLSLSQMQLIEIVKSIHLNAKILIMDEPTAALTTSETEILFEHIRRLKQKGCGIVFISHRLSEIKQVADRITVLRDGRHIRTEQNEQFAVEEIISTMVGRAFDGNRKRENRAGGEIVLEVKNLSNRRLHDISFSLKKGEVLGVTGLVGAGRSELLQTLFGDMAYDSGEIYLHGKKAALNSVKSSIDNRMALVPEGRKTQGLFAKLSVGENIGIVNRVYTSKFGFIAAKEMRRKIEEVKNKLSIKASSLSTEIVNLSGGNQQKSIIGKWLINDPEILLLDEPTHGIDVGAKSEIYTIIDGLSREGVSIILVSSEMPEILTLADRILTMYQGRINGELVNTQVTQEEIMSYITNQPNKVRVSGG
ncbi:MAG: sugar ABC transporter ATP-binding protein [Treponema sp.]|jgi:ABC-type sugar transport system ATPase subunit|nr:sugar ABC transporter ATP-binding protein [Treponema sp.]